MFFCIPMEAMGGGGPLNSTLNTIGNNIHKPSHAHLLFLNTDYYSTSQDIRDQAMTCTQDKTKHLLTGTDATMHTGTNRGGQNRTLYIVNITLPINVKQ